jgi:predicted TIM-barrel fold metal-dependent hydrolase
MTTPLRYVDADGHALEPPTGLQEHAPAAYRDRVLHLETDPAGHEWVVADGHRVRSNRHTFLAAAGLSEKEKLACAAGDSPYVFSELSKAAWDAPTRLAKMDRDHIDISVLYPTMLLSIQGWPDVEYAAVTCRAYNDWLSEHCAGSGNRLYGMAVLPQQSIEAAVTELRRVADLPGVVGGFLRPNPTPDWKHFDDEMWNPVWHAAADTNLTIGFHPYLDALLPGACQGLHVGELGRGAPLPNTLPDQPSGLDNVAFSQALANPVDMMTTVMFVTMGGVCERYPEVRFVFLEANGGWLVPWLERLDHHAHEFPWDLPPLELTPSGYFRRQCWISFDPDESSLAFAATSRYCGANRIVWASDFPHADAKYPGLTDELTEALAPLPPLDQALITAENALALYDIDAPKEAR